LSCKALPGTGQNTIGVGDLDEITGEIFGISPSGKLPGGGPGQDVDLFLIFIPNPALFSATTVGTPGTIANTQLFLFDQAGFGRVANDNAAPGVLRSTLPLGHPLIVSLSPGLYLLGISAFDRDPVSAAGLIFNPLLTTDVVGPNGPGGGAPVIGYTGIGGQGGTYTIQLTGAQFAIQQSPSAVPEPTAITLFGLGALGLLGYGWRRRKRAA